MLDEIIDDMGKIIAKVEKIVVELRRLQSVSQPFRDNADNFHLPRLIYAGTGGSISVSELIDDEISKVADQLIGNDLILKRSFTVNEWRKLVRNAFGPALASIDLDGDLSENAQAILTQVKSSVDTHKANYDIREYVFGCTLFSNEKVRPFNIGPVRFERRHDWLARKHRDKEISDASFRRVKKIWNGERVRKRSSTDYLHERDILTAIRNSPFVCSVVTVGLSSEAGREKALTAARLATASIALLWSSSSKQLDGMNLMFDRSMFRQVTLVFIPGKRVLAGSRISNMPHGPYMHDDEWEMEFERHKDFFQTIGAVLEYVISPTGMVSRPNMMNVLMQALLWFHEGCREIVTLMAIVKFSAALDALACGGRSNGIKKLIKARLEIDEKKPVYPDGPDLNEAIDRIYSHGRSRTIHGTSDKLGHDWTQTRGLAEQFARYCLVACVYWVAENSTSDDPKDLSIK